MTKLTAPQPLPRTTTRFFPGVRSCTRDGSLVVADADDARTTTADVDRFDLRRIDVDGSDRAAFVGLDVVIIMMFKWMVDAPSRTIDGTRRQLRVKSKTDVRTFARWTTDGRRASTSPAASASTDGRRTAKGSVRRRKKNPRVCVVRVKPNNVPDNSNIGMYAHDITRDPRRVLFPIKVLGFSQGLGAAGFTKKCIAATHRATRVTRRRRGER